MRSPTSNYAQLRILLEDILLIYHIDTIVLLRRFLSAQGGRKIRKIVEQTRHYSILDKIPRQLEHLDRLVHLTNADCIANLRMDRNTFGRLCRVLRDRGWLRCGHHVGVEEQVEIMVGVLAHHNKNRVVKFIFRRSGSTISHYVNKVLGAVLTMSSVLFPKPTPVPDNCDDPRWKWFKVCSVLFISQIDWHSTVLVIQNVINLVQGCLGALDGTHINVLVNNADKPRFKSRKGHISTNTLDVCDRNLQFVYFLAGWEGSAGDSRVLRDAVARPRGLKVPKGPTCFDELQ